MSTAHASSEPVHVDLLDLARRTWHLFALNPLLHLMAGAVLVLGSLLSLSLLTGPLLVGYIGIVHDLSEDRPARVGDLTRGFQRLGPALGVWLAMLAGILIGTALFILPGVALGFLWVFAPWGVARREHGVGGALAASWHCVRDNAGPCLLVVLAVTALNLGGSLLVVGTFPTLPLGLIALTLAFEDLCPE